MKKIILATGLLFSVMSCDRYLDIQPTGKLIATSVEDYDLLLNGGDYSIHTITNQNPLALSADNFFFNPVGNIDPNNIDNQDFQLYSFSTLRFANPSTAENSWNGAYSNIYTFNKVINEVLSATASVGYSDGDKQRIKAEAHFGRALDYFYLVNTFAKHYSPSNLSSDGVPLVLIADVTQTLGDRNSVGEVYQQVISDLEEAIPNLPSRGSNRTRPSKASGYALLSRVYLYMGKYNEALENANKALALNGNLANYTTSPNLAALRTAYASEQYSYRFFGVIGGYNATLSSDLKSIFDLTNDARYFHLYQTVNGRDSRRGILELNQLPSVGEMYITRAEIHARLGNTNDALSDLNTLRNNRILSNTALSSSDFATPTALLGFILEERRRELYLNGTRLFDIKRLNLESDFAKTITHTYNGVNYTAEPSSNKLVLPIPAQVMKFNTHWRQN